jgi:isoleucyl-tRNA synthetase
MAAPPELKATLNLPRTDFAMKANLPQNEPKMLAHWEQMGLYDQIRQARQGAPMFVMHDGPPYANGPIHLGTALNKTLKDFVVKSRTMAGFDAPYIPGWDCHGLPIEFKVDNDLGGKKLTMPPLEIRLACRKYAEKYLDLQRSQFKRIGVFGRFENPYSTMSPQYEAVVVETFFDFLEHGFVYKGLKPVYWCWHDRTALAEAEVEYENHTSPSIWVRYRLQSDPRTIHPALAEARILKDKPVYTIIWTTTPWTLPASMAVAFHPDEEYVALEADDAIYLVAARRATETAEKCGFPRARTLGALRGQALENTWFQHPFLPWPERKILGVLGEYVTMDQGTGAVHTAPSHGPDDFYTGVKYKLDQSCNVDAGGHLRNGLPEYDGQTVFQANPHIVALLASRGALLHEEKLEHSYPHCWRCHNPVIFRATEQWFISMEGKLEGGTLRSRSLDEIKKVKWDPEWGEERISNMIATRPDWCISRQRVWGVPIAVFFCEGCGDLLRSPQANRAVVELFAREGADAWYKYEAAGILPAGTKCPKCGEVKFRKESDIIDVWFESGCSSLAVLPREGLRWPADLYVEAGDQYRGWFHSSLLCGVGTKNHAPYLGVATHGWTLDAQGRAMSKSLGNTVDPVDICKRLGGEIVRLWVASVDFREDVRNSEDLMQRVAESYRKIRNTFRFMLGNLHGFDPARDAVPFGEMRSLDRYLLLRAGNLTEQVREWYDKFLFHRIYQAVNEFCVVDLSAVYFDVTRDRLYTSAPRARGRRSAQTALWRIAEVLVRLLAPMMSFTADEIWQALPAVAGREPSAHISLFPTRDQIVGDAAAKEAMEPFLAEWGKLLEVRAEVLKAMEAARNSKLIGSSLEAQVKIAAPASLYDLLEKHLQEGTLRELFIVSGVALGRAPAGNGAAGIQVAVEHAPGEKCERCWNYSVQVGQDPSYPTVCERCSAALKELNRG